MRGNIVILREFLIRMGVIIFETHCMIPILCDISYAAYSFQFRHITDCSNHYTRAVQSFEQVKIGGNFPKTIKLNSKSWLVGLGDATFLPYLPVLTLSLS